MKVHILRRRLRYRGRLVCVYEDQLQVSGLKIQREILEHPGSVVILPLLDASHLLMVRQYRHAARRSLLELPAGTLTRREPPAVCAARELEEETGYWPGRLRRLAEFYPAPGVLSERMRLFLADRLRRGSPHPEPDELVSPVILTTNEALRRVQSGAICDAKSIIGIVWWHLWADAARRHRLLQPARRSARLKGSHGSAQRPAPA